MYKIIDNNYMLKYLLPKELNIDISKEDVR